MQKSLFPPHYLHFAHEQLLNGTAAFGTKTVQVHTFYVDRNVEMLIYVLLSVIAQLLDNKMLSDLSKWKNLFTVYERG